MDKIIKFGEKKVLRTRTSGEEVFVQIDLLSETGESLVLQETTDTGTEKIYIPQKYIFYHSKKGMIIDFEFCSKKIYGGSKYDDFVIEGHYDDIQNLLTEKLKKAKSILD
ncbi:hypothetical protein KA977_15810 [Candidatus Dependentiae bacterium]|nr:hypothetical protein [Candidatus Dependentiae bacterium]